MELLSGNDIRGGVGSGGGCVDGGGNGGFDVGETRFSFREVVWSEKLLKFFFRGH